MHIKNIYASILQYQTLNSIWTLMYDCCSYLAYEPKYIFQKWNSSSIYDNQTGLFFKDNKTFSKFVFHICELLNIMLGSAFAAHSEIIAYCIFL